VRQSTETVAPAIKPMAISPPHRFLTLSAFTIIMAMNDCSCGGNHNSPPSHRKRPAFVRATDPKCIRFAGNGTSRRGQRDSDWLHGRRALWIGQVGRRVMRLDWLSLAARLGRPALVHCVCSPVPARVPARANLISLGQASETCHCARANPPSALGIQRGLSPASATQIGATKPSTFRLEWRIRIARR